MTMMEAFSAVAASRLGQKALVCGLPAPGSMMRLTYGQLLEGIDALAQGFLRLGIRRGDVVAALLSPGPDFVHVFFAVAQVGAVFVPLSPQVRRRGLGAVLQDAEPVALVTHRPVEDDVLRLVPGLRYVISAGVQGDLTLADLLADKLSVGDPSPVRRSSVVSSDDLLALLYTSGTTGTPKGTMHVHRSLIAPVVASIKLRELWLKRPNLKTVGQMAVALARYRERLLRAAGRPQCFLSTTSWHTITGLESMLQALLMGDRLVAMPRFHPRRALELIEQERVTVLIAVPTALQVMLSVQEAAQREDGRGYDVSSLLICGTGAAPCPPHLAREIRSRFGCAIHIGFGATETAGGISATSLADSDDRQAETVGQPMPGVEVKVVDEDRRELPSGEVGELACRSEGVMRGYYRAPEATAQVMDDEGWYYTGDLARIDEDGYVHIVGRIKDVIIRGGQNVYPAEIETYLAAHDRIREAVVVGMPAAIGGESVWAFVILADGVKMTSQDVLSYCRQELEAFKIPSQVRFVADFPRTETGKPKKFELRAHADVGQAYLAAEGAGRDAAPIGSPDPAG
jgi:acyl-CoA synthetase (AMP-forming)/AMP-acid ligase II